MGDMIDIVWFSEDKSIVADDYLYLSTSTRE